MSTNRLEGRLAVLRRTGRRALAPFVTAGDGRLERTLAVLRALDAAGVACVELGLPFSDPIADGPVLQAAAERAIAAGTTFDGVCAMVSALRTGDARHPPCDLPIALMSYLNPLLVRGLSRSARELAAAGIDGWLVPDVPVEEGADLRVAGDAAGLTTTFFVAPTTRLDRIELAASRSRGFVYAIGRFGVTGASTELDAGAQAFLEHVRAAAGGLPVAVGFGIDSPAKVRAAVRHADLAIVGSALVEHVDRAGGDPRDGAEAAFELVRALQEGLPA